MSERWFAMSERLIIIGPRRSGRSTAIVNWAMSGGPDEFRVVMTATREQERHLINLGLHPSHVRPASMAYSLRGIRDLVVGMDDFEYIPREAYAHFPVGALTLEGSRGSIQILG